MSTLAYSSGLGPSRIDVNAHTPPLFCHSPIRVRSRRRRFFTFDACQRQPRRVSMPRLLSAAAMAPRLVLPARRTLRKGGSVAVLGASQCRRGLDKPAKARARGGDPSARRPAGMAARCSRRRLFDADAHQGVSGRYQGQLPNYARRLPMPPNSPQWAIGSVCRWSGRGSVADGGGDQRLSAPRQRWPQISRA